MAKSMRTMIFRYFSIFILILDLFVMFWVGYVQDLSVPVCKITIQSSSKPERAPWSSNIETEWGFFHSFTLYSSKKHTNTFAQPCRSVPYVNTSGINLNATCRQVIKSGGKSETRGVEVAVEQYAHIVLAMWCFLSTPSLIYYNTRSNCSIL